MPYVDLKLVGKLTVPTGAPAGNCWDNVDNSRLKYYNIMTNYIINEENRPPPPLVIAGGSGQKLIR